MQTNRRNLFRAILASPLAAMASKAGQAEPVASLKPANKIPDGRPCAYPSQYTVRFIPSLTVSRMYETMAACSCFKLQPLVISMNGKMMEQLRFICPEIFHWYVRSEMADRGWRTYPFNGAEVVEDRFVKDDVIWFITPGQEDPRHHAQLIVVPFYPDPPWDKLEWYCGEGHDQ